MFCPACKSEYRVGFTKCGECNVPLVEHLEDESTLEGAPQTDLSETDLVSVLTSLDSAIVSDIVAQIEVSGIPYLLQSGTAFPLPDGLIGDLSSPTWQAVLFVPGQYVESAQTIIQKIRDQVSAERAETEDLPPST